MMKAVELVMLRMPKMRPSSIAQPVCDHVSRSMCEQHVSHNRGQWIPGVNRWLRQPKRLDGSVGHRQAPLLLPSPTPSGRYRCKTREKGVPHSAAERGKSGRMACCPSDCHVSKSGCSSILPALTAISSERSACARRRVVFGRLGENGTSLKKNRTIHHSVVWAQSFKEERNDVGRVEEEDKVHVEEGQQQPVSVPMEHDVAYVDGTTGMPTIEKIQFLSGIAKPAGEAEAEGMAMEDLAPSNGLPINALPQLPGLDDLLDVSTGTGSDGTAVIKVVGIGGTGCNVVNDLVKNGDISDENLYVMNTDMQALRQSSVPNSRRILLGGGRRIGFSLRGSSQLAEKLAEASEKEIRNALEGADMVFITAGMGGGTGGAAAPVVAGIAKGMGALTVGIVTRPFRSEGQWRTLLAEKQIETTKKHVDTLIVIPSDKLLEASTDEAGEMDSFRVADEVIRQGVKGITDMITMPGLVNVDFAVLKELLADSGHALLGIGSAEGEDRARTAAKAAVSSPLLQKSIREAKAVVYSVTGDSSMSLYEVTAVSEVVYNVVNDENAHVVFAANTDENMNGQVQVVVIAAGLPHTIEQSPVAGASLPEAHGGQRRHMKGKSSGGGFNMSSSNSDFYPESSDPTYFSEQATVV